MCTGRLTTAWLISSVLQVEGCSDYNAALEDFGFPLPMAIPGEKIESFCGLVILRIEGK